MALLCINIGNTNIVLGLWHEHRWLHHWRIETVHGRMPDEYAVLLRSLFRDAKYDWTDIDRVVMASVVPPLTPTFRDLAARNTSREPIVVGPGVRTGVRIRIDNPVELGADLVADAVAAYERFRTACIIVDLGTATTFSAVSAEGDFLGVAIAPGLRLSAEALSRETSQLPRVNLVPPPCTIGKNTIHSMQSGLVLGHIGMIEGLLRRMRAELGGTCKVIATGGMSGLLAPLTNEFDAVDIFLTLDGLRIIAERNAD